MTDKFDVAVCIGRFQLLHKGQLAMLQRALAIAPQVVVILGSALQARSPRHPFNWQERAQMILLALPKEDAARVRFVPLRDYYDPQRWVEEVHRAVGAARGARVALVGHRKDAATSAYLNDFPGWHLVDVGSQGELHANALRAALYASSDVDAGLAAIAHQVPESTVEFLRAWSQLPFLETLRAEWQTLVAERAKWQAAPYPPIFVTVDALLRIGDHVLLIRRGRHPGKGLLALPGGFIDERETAYQSALRELQEETGFSMLPSDMRSALKEVRVFDHPARSQRGRVITHAHYFAFAGARLPEVAASDDAAEATWVPIAEIAALESQFHEDHFHILDVFLNITPMQAECYGASELR
jgi:bifunctional NMN adenylyltransferase/nudix hydrolase